MLPIFVGLVAWIVLLAGCGLIVVLASRRLRPFSGFVFFPPVAGVGGAFLGFLAVGWFFNNRVRAELAASLAFYLGFLLCGMIGVVVGLVGGFVVWWRLRRSTLVNTEGTRKVEHPASQL